MLPIDHASPAVSPPRRDPRPLLDDVYWRRILPALPEESGHTPDEVHAVLLTLYYRRGHELRTDQQLRDHINRALLLCEWLGLPMAQVLWPDAEPTLEIAPMQTRSDPPIWIIP